MTEKPKGKITRYPIDYVLAPVDNLLHNKPISGILLFVAVIAALIMANSSFAEFYHHLWETHFTIRLGDLEIDKSIHHWINDGLMSIFFFVVGLEIKREILAGELSSVKSAILPIGAALGGMLVPAVIYLAFNAGEAGEAGWGIPMATDIAFALGVLSLLGNRVPLSLKIFLTALAIVDDLGAVLVIAFFYTENLLFLYLEYGLAFLAILAIGNIIGVRHTAFYAIVGICGLWFAFLLSGVHATIAGVLLAMTIPIKAKMNKTRFISKVQNLLNRLQTARSIEGAYISDEQHEIIENIKVARAKVETPLQKLEHALNPFVSFIVLPLFAFSNSGIELNVPFTEAFQDPIAIGIILGLVIGKFLGIFGFSWVLVKLKLAQLPADINWGILAGTAIMGGIGFTMSIFISGLAFENSFQIAESKMAILIASSLAGVIGMLIITSQLKKTKKKK